MLIIQSKMINLYQKYIKFDQKWSIYIKNIEFDQKLSKTTGFLINFDICDQIGSIFDINQLFQYKSDKT